MKDQSRTKKYKLSDYIYYTLVYLMAGLFLLFGSSKFYPFMPTPEVDRKAAVFLAALMATKYMWPLVGFIEVTGGILLLFHRTRLAGALLLMPVIVHIVLYLWFLAKTGPGIPMGLFLLSVQFCIFWKYRNRLKRILIAGEEEAI